MKDLKMKCKVTHFERMKMDAALEYVTKEETRVDGPFTYGTKPKKGVKYVKMTTKEILTTPII